MTTTLSDDLLRLADDFARVKHLIRVAALASGEHAHAPAFRALASTIEDYADVVEETINSIRLRYAGHEVGGTVRRMP